MKREIEAQTGMQKLRVLLKEYCDNGNLDVCFPKPEEMDWDEYAKITEHRGDKLQEYKQAKLEEIYAALKQTFLEKLNIELSDHQVACVWECATIEPWENNASKMLSRIVGILTSWEEVMRMSE